MRSVFLILVLVNLAVFVWAGGFLGQRDEGREPERMAAQLQPERMQVGRDVKITPVESSCRRIGPLAVADADVLERSLVDGKLLVTRTTTVESPVSYWVMIPSADGKAPEKDISTLRKSGFKEFTVVQEEGANRNAVSLGTFATQDAAREKLDRLVRNGIKTARIAVKPGASKVQLSARGPSDVLARLLAEATVPVTECPKQ